MHVEQAPRRLEAVIRSWGRRGAGRGGGEVGPGHGGGVVDVQVAEVACAEGRGSPNDNVTLALKIQEMILLLPFLPMA